MVKFEKKNDTQEIFIFERNQKIGSCFSRHRKIRKLEVIFFESKTPQSNAVVKKNSGQIRARFRVGPLWALILREPGPKTRQLGTRFWTKHWPTTGIILTNPKPKILDWWIFRWFSVTSMLVTDVGDQMRWWAVWDVGDRLNTLRKSPTYRKKSPT